MIWRLAFLLSLALACAAAYAASPAAQAAQRHRLYQQQLQDEMTLHLQQDLARSQPGLTTRDRMQLDQLNLRQRIEQQQLEQQQIVESRQAPHNPAAVQARQQIFADERALQLQRFAAEQQRALDATHPAPLQPRTNPGELAP